MVDIKEVAPNIYHIDNQLYSIPGMGSAYLLNEVRKALVEVGPSSAVGLVLEGIRQIGVKPEDVDYIIVTHVHLDHGGGAGLLLKDMPKARVVVHHRGARHLAAPAKLVNGMREAQGEEVLARCGEVIPVPGERLQAVGEGDALELSKEQVLRFMDAPGHAPHELCIWETRHGGVFSGEAAGSLLGEGRVLFPFNTPPSFDLEKFVATIRRLMELRPTAIYYSHFGVSHRVRENLEKAVNRVLVWGEIVSRALKESRTDRIVERIMAEVRGEMELVRDRKGLYQFIQANVPACVAAYLKYYQDKAPRNDGK